MGFVEEAELMEKVVNVVEERMTINIIVASYVLKQGPFVFIILYAL